MKNNPFTISWKVWKYLILALILPAFLINLGALAFIEDESIRAIVALEMLDSGNYIAPQINGDAYYYKPPLYNWFIALSYALFGVAAEWTSRIPTLVFLFAFFIAIYKISTPYFGKQWSFINACIMITCGRILFYESFLGLIDIGYSFITYASILSIYLYRNSRYKQAFLSFGLTAIGYLMKGFPSLLFLSISYFVFHLWQRKKYRFFHPSIGLGVLLLGSIVGGYYFLLNQHQDATEAFAPLLDQSTRRTILRYPLVDAIKHIFSYPFENVMHFFPWSLLTLLMLDVKTIQSVIKKHPFIAFNGVMFLANILPYWVSPEVYARYVLMLIPFYFTFFLFVFKWHYDHQTKWFNLIKKIFQILFVITPIAIAFSVLSIEIKMVPNYIFYAALFTLLTGIVSYFSVTNNKAILPGMIVLLLVVRIFFNVLVVPSRVLNDHGTIVRTETKRIEKTYQPLFLYKNARMDRTSSFYLAANKMEANQRKETLEKGKYYIVDTISTALPNSEIRVLDSFPIREYRRTAYVIKRK